MTYAARAAMIEKKFKGQNTYGWETFINIIYKTTVQPGFSGEYSLAGGEGFGAAWWDGGDASETELCERQDLWGMYFWISLYCQKNDVYAYGKEAFFYAGEWQYWISDWMRRLPNEYKSRGYGRVFSNIIWK